MAYVDVVDLERYPIHDLAGAAGQALVALCQEQLLGLGACTLPGFLTPPAVEAMVDIAGVLARHAWVSDETHTVYFEPVDGSVDAGDPRARLERSAKRGIAYDCIPTDAPIRRLYESDDLTCFVGAVLQLQPLYRSADPLDALQITRFETGDELGWHFDRSEFSVTVMYQPAESGGDFDYYPRLRSDRDANYTGVRRVLDGDPSGIVRLPSGPGTFAVFRGQHALHRVTAVRGRVPRINSVLTYGQRPDMRLNDLTSLLFYGRTSVRHRRTHTTGP